MQVTFPSMAVAITLFLETGVLLVISAFKILCSHKMEPSRFTAIPSPELEGTYITSPDWLHLSIPQEIKACPCKMELTCPPVLSV